jgi:hypothetical protein
LIAIKLETGDFNEIGNYGLHLSCKLGITMKLETRDYNEVAN